MLHVSDFGCHFLDSTFLRTIRGSAHILKVCRSPIVLSHWHRLPWQELFQEDQAWSDRKGLSGSQIAVTVVLHWQLLENHEERRLFHTVMALVRILMFACVPLSLFRQAMPVFGTGGGGEWHSAGKVIAQMFPLVQAAAIENDVDVVICALDADVYAALQVRFAYHGNT